MGAPEAESSSRAIAEQWCESRGPTWSVVDQLGRGGTAVVFHVRDGTADLALKIYDAHFSSGNKREIEEIRVERQRALRNHDCPTLIEVIDGGWFKDRLFVLMAKAVGHELAKKLGEVPRTHIRSIVDQIARAAAFLRDKGLCHRDIKSENVIVSSDYSRATLLDLSVTRTIADPIGAGTDHEGQLPIVATARYSPPEYLFRLVEPSKELWHALDVYQLGAFLYDLIERKQLFQEEYEHSKENRYRFAWIVATAEPEITATDVDADLLYLVRRALSKDWRARSSLTLESFFADAPNRRARALATLGIGDNGKDTAPPARDVAALYSTLEGTVSVVEEKIIEYLRTCGVICSHNERSAAKLEKELVFRWSADRNAVGAGPVQEFTIRLALLEQSGTLQFAATTRLRAHEGSEPKSASIPLPKVPADDEPGTKIAQQCIDALAELADKIIVGEDA